MVGAEKTFSTPEDAEGQMATDKKNAVQSEKATDAQILAYNREMIGGAYHTCGVGGEIVEARPEVRGFESWFDGVNKHRMMIASAL